MTFNIESFVRITRRGQRIIETHLYAFCFYWLLRIGKKKTKTVYKTGIAKFEVDSLFLYCILPFIPVLFLHSKTKILTCSFLVSYSIPLVPPETFCLFSCHQVISTQNNFLLAASILLAKFSSSLNISVFSHRRALFVHFLTGDWVLSASSLTDCLMKLCLTRYSDGAQL